MKSFFKEIVASILEFESRAIVQKYRPIIIAVTGSVGKTSTKDAIYTVLSGSSFARKSQKSFNSEIGVPLTVLGCENGWNNPFLWIRNILEGLELILFKAKYPECLILEVGADKPGDIERITRWLKPDIVVMTRVSDVPVHVEFFPSAEALFQEKSYLAKALRKDGTLVLSSDDEKIRNLGYGKKALTFGVNSLATVTASDYSILYEEGRASGVSFNLNYNGASVPVRIPHAIGITQMYPLAAAAAVGILRGMSLDQIGARASLHIPSKGRMNLIKGINGSTIIDDTYNSSPDALHQALDALASVNGSRKIAVIGDMLELGKYSIEEHRKAGEHANRVASLVISVGQRARLMPGVSASFDSSLDAADYLSPLVQAGDVILVKGSQSIRMERIVKALMVDSEKAGELLVRQDKEWLAKK